MVYRKTFFTGDDITRSGYDIGTSPIICPGQTIKAAVHLSVGEGITARLFVRDYWGKELICSEPVALTAGQTTDLDYTIASPEPALLDRMGILFSSAEPRHRRSPIWTGWTGRENPWSGPIRLDRPPEPMTGWSYLRGQWLARGGALSGSHYGQDAEAYTGMQSWSRHPLQCAAAATLRPTAPHSVSRAWGTALLCIWPGARWTRGL